MSLTIIGSAMPAGFTETTLSSGSVITANASIIVQLGPNYDYYYASHRQPGANAVYMIGSQGDEVKWIQCAMNWIFRANKQPLRIDGIYGSQTAYWVKAYQKAVGITVDGKFGPQTRAKVLDYLRRTPYKGK